MKNVVERWVEELAADPAGSVAAVLTGRMSRGTLQGADADASFVAALGTSGPEREGVRGHLDQGIASWLDGRREMTLLEIHEYGVSALISQLELAFITVARLRLSYTAGRMAEQYLVWEEWLKPLRRQDWIDVLAAFDEALALNQEDDRLSPRWFDVLAEAAWGGTGWKRSLRTGLLGLRKLPHEPGTQPESLVAAGLIHFVQHALANGTLAESEVASTFQREAIALTSLYPRSGEHWWAIWEAALAQARHLRRQKRAFGDWLQQQLGPVGLLTPGRQAGRQNRPPRAPARKGRGGIEPAKPPRKEEHDDLLRRLGARRWSVSLWNDLRGHIDRHFKYAERSGDGYLLVRTVHKLGDTALGVPLPRPVVLVIRSWVIAALSFEPDNTFLWPLWAKVHTTLARPDDALSILWESVRRFPHNVVVRNTLSNALRRYESTALAESVLRDTVRDFDDVVAKHSLANLMRKTGRMEEAERLLRELIRVRPVLTHSVCELATLLLDAHRHEEAEALLRTLDPADYVNEYPLVILGRCLLRRATGGPKESAAELLAQAEEMIATAEARFPRRRAVADLRKHIQEDLARYRRSGEVAPDVAMDAAVPASFEAFDEEEPLISLSEASPAGVDAGDQLSDEPVRCSDAEREESEAENFLRLNVERGREYAAWYEAREGEQPGFSSELGATDEVGAVLRCVQLGGSSPRIRPPHAATLETQPGSYSLQLLAAYGGAREGNSRAFMNEAERLGRPYAELNDLLLFPILPAHRKKELLGDGKRGGVSRERLEMVYPGLAPGNPERARAELEPDETAYARLVGDVARACAARTQPRTASAVR